MTEAQLNVLEKLPKSKRKTRTFLEIIKASHRETIMANLLAYYFNPSEEHGLGSLFIEALLQTECYHLNEHKSCNPLEGQLERKDFSNVEVITEDSTDNQKRIDILIKGNDFVIAIEFKINHNLNNPLHTYIKHIEQQYPNHKNKYFVVLAPSWKQPELSKKENSLDVNEKFKQVLLGHFIQKVESLKKQRMLRFQNQEDPQYHYYTDFMNTIKNRRIMFETMKAYQERAEEDPEFESRVNSLFQDLKKIKNELEGKMHQVSKNLDGYNSIESSKDKLESVIEKQQGNKSIKLRLTLRGWGLEQWVDRKNKKQELKQLKLSEKEQMVVEKALELEEFFLNTK